MADDDFDFGFGYDSTFDFDGDGHLDNFERVEQFNEEERDFQAIMGTGPHPKSSRRVNRPPTEAEKKDARIGCFTLIGLILIVVVWKALADSGTLGIGLMVCIGGFVTYMTYATLKKQKTRLFSLPWKGCLLLTLAAVVGVLLGLCCLHLAAGMEHIYFQGNIYYYDYSAHEKALFNAYSILTLSGWCFACAATDLLVCAVWLRKAKKYTPPD